MLFVFVWAWFVLSFMSNLATSAEWCHLVLAYFGSQCVSLEQLGALLLMHLQEMVLGPKRAEIEALEGQLERTKMQVKTAETNIIKLTTEIESMVSCCSLPAANTLCGKPTVLSPISAVQPAETASQCDFVS